MRRASAVFLLAALPAVITAAHADVVISSGATANMACSAGVCVPTAKNAVLNVSDLENLLSSGNVEVTTTGSGIQAGNLNIDAPLAWSNTNALALDAWQTVLVEKPVSVTGAGGLSVTTNDGGKDGYFGFRGKGHVAFSSLSSALVVNGASYTLEGNIRSLAAAIAANSGGNFALAGDYDASGDGAYQNSAIPTQFSGNFEGLGNTISNLSLSGTGDINSPVGFFAQLALNNGPGGTAENIGLKKLYIVGDGFDVGGVAGINNGKISGAFVSGHIESELTVGVCMGLLVGVNGGPIIRSGAAGTVVTSQRGCLGGLAGAGGENGTITDSFASVKITGGASSVAGALEASSSGPVVNSYVEGSITVRGSSVAGGLVGENAYTVAQSYSTTALQGIKHQSHNVGGLIGIDYSDAGSVSSSYWDTSTSHITNLRLGAGTPRNDPGITGLTTEQLQAGLPKGFDPKVWAEDRKINNGLPYLIDNPPRKD